MCGVVTALMATKIYTVTPIFLLLLDTLILMILPHLKTHPFF